MTDILFDTHQKKKLGIYYTDQLVADFLVSWAIDDKENRILDPSYGDGVFIVSAFNKIKSLGGG